MSSIIVIGEDDLSCTLGTRLVQTTLPDWKMPNEPINTRGVTRLRASIHRYHGSLVHLHHVLCVADTDNACPVGMLRDWLPDGAHPNFLLRFAVRESDAWVLADRRGFAHAFGVSEAVVSRNPDALIDAKREILQLSARSSKRQIKQEMTAEYDKSKAGSGYNQHLCSFVRSAWDPLRAAEESPSLRRALASLKRLRESVELTCNDGGGGRSAKQTTRRGASRSEPK